MTAPGSGDVQEVISRIFSAPTLDDREAARDEYLQLMGGLPPEPDDEERE